MCGIAGLFAVSRSLLEPEESAAAVSKMLGTLVHRGPDAIGIWSDPRSLCHLGHRRLSIIDTSDAGRQPMAGAGGRWAVTFNGEIYNFLELRPRLETRGTTFKGRTDTEVLIEAVAAWGPAALERLDGQFAFAAFDTVSGELLLARDPFGEKPLYYIELPAGGVAFASELQALETLPFFDADVSLDAVGELLTFQYVGAPRSIYRSVKKLPPGHWMLARAGHAPEIRRYFGFAPGSRGFDNRPLADLADEAEEILVRNLRRRMISDVPLGAFLSGGVDSSTVCALIRMRLQLPLKTFSIGFQDAKESEHEAARVFARHLGTEHYDEMLKPDTADFLLHIGAVQDEPNADSSSMPTYLLSRFARQRVTVAISGDGGDELFFGYGRYFATLDEALGAGKRWSPGVAYYSGRILVSSEEDLQDLLGFLPEGTARHLGLLRGEIDRGRSVLECALRRSDVDNYMPGAVLAKVDRMSMQHSLEVRTPFLSVDLARFTERLPPEVLYRSGRGKILLKEIGGRYLPRALLDAPKKGFGIPMSGWGRETLLDVLQEMLQPAESRLAQMIGAEKAKAFIAKQRSVQGFSSYQVWAVCTLESWLRHHRAKLPDIRSEQANTGRVRPLAQKAYYAAVKPATPIAQALWYSRQLYLSYQIYGLRGASFRARRKLLRTVQRIGKKIRTRAFVTASYVGRAPVFLSRLARIASHPGGEGVVASARQELSFYLHGSPLLDRVRNHVAREEAGLQQLRPLRRGDPVVLVTYALPPGGAERQWCYLAIGLKAQGYVVTMALVDEPEGSNGHYLPLLLEHGIEVVVLRRKNGTPPVSGDEPNVKFLAALEYFRPFGLDFPGLTRLLSARQPQAVFAQLDYPNLLAATASLVTGVPQVLLSFRNYNPSNFSYLRNDWFLPFYLAVCQSRRVVLSGNSIAGNRDYASWLRVPTERVARITNAIDIEAWKPVAEEPRRELRRKLHIADGIPIVLGVFRLSEEKRPFDFIEVYRKVRSSSRPVQFLIAGEGPMQAALESLVQEYGLQDGIRFLGRRSDIRNLMSIATIVLHTSGFEGMPNAIMEAQAMGRAVVATRAGAVAEIIVHGKTGFLADVGDIDALAQYCGKLVDSPSMAEAFGSASCAYVREHFSMEQLAQRHVELLNSLRTGRSGENRQTIITAAERNLA